MTDKELWERLHENAEWARCNEWETPLCLADDLTAAADAIERLRNEAEGMRSNWSKSVITIKRLKSELTQEKIDNTNLIGELATVAAERDRYKAERDAAERESPQPSTNADRIRGMSDDELAKFLATKLNDDFYGCPDLILQWLQQPAEEEQT